MHVTAANAHTGDMLQDFHRSAKQPSYCFSFAQTWYDADQTLCETRAPKQNINQW
jgi:hypothetical protein